MGNFIKRRFTLATVLAGAFALSACSVPAATPATGSTGTTPNAASTAATAPAPSGPKPVVYDALMMQAPSGSDAAQEQMIIAQDFVSKMTANGYTLSGQWTLDGNTQANTAKLWDNYFSDELKSKLTAAGKDGDLKGFGTWSVFAVAPADSKDAIKASPSCKPAFAMCALAAPSQPMPGAIIDTTTPGSMGVVGGSRAETMNLLTPNRIAFDFDVVVPVSLTEQGNAEGVLRGLLKVDLTFVENPTPAGGRPKYLINSVNNNLIDAKADLLTNNPDLSFFGA